MDDNMELYSDGEFLMAEFELDGDLIVNSNDLQPGTTVLVSNEQDGIVSHEDLTKFFELENAVPMPTEEAVERTLADPALKQILQEADGKVDFDPEIEQEKLREFLSGVKTNNILVEKNTSIGAVVAPTATPTAAAATSAAATSAAATPAAATSADTAASVVPKSRALGPNSRAAVPKMTTFRFIKCANCNALFDTPSFQNHRCGVDSKQKAPSVNPVQPAQEKKISKSPRKTATERIIIENQVRIRRYMKDELKYDLESGLDGSKMKKSSSKGPNECSICERKFVHTSGLVRHMEKHALDQIPMQANFQQPHAAPSAVGLLVVLKCNHCGRIFYDVKMALEHIFVHQLTPEIPDPSTIVEDPEILRTQLTQLLQEGEHLFAITAELERLSLKNEDEYYTTLVLGNVLQCEFCDYIFADVSFLLMHSATHVPERRFECTACDLRMTTAKEASIHYQTDCVYMREGLKQLQAQPARFFVCNVCEVKFANVELLQEHRYSCYHYFPRLSEDGKRLVLPCEFCSTNFEYAHEIQPHYEEKHLNKKKREKDLRNSGNNSTIGRLRQYLCDICGKSYTQSSHLWQHLRFHQGVKPFVCQEENCGRKFTIRPDLNDHIRKCHTGERPYHCVVCGKRFLTGSVFYQHRLIHRGERRYECDECGKRFYRADALKNHQRIHTGEKPYDCPFCTKTFRQRGDRDKHVRARHSHLDANARLMMQMQKFELETAAALKAKQMQEAGMEYVIDPMVVATMPTSTSPMVQEPQYMIELDPNDFGQAAEFVPTVPMSVNDDEQVMAYVDVQEEVPMDPQEFQLENTENVKVVVIDNNTSQPYYF